MTVHNQDELHQVLKKELAIIGRQLDDVCRGTWWSLQRDGRVIFWFDDLAIDLRRE